MNYYQRHIGDYAKKAGHLSMLEHGAYCQLMDRYYDTELGPTRAEALRWTRARTAEEVAAVDAVLAEFFTLDGDRYRQSRIEEEFAKWAEYQENQRAKGKKGGRPRKAVVNPEESSGFSEESSGQAGKSLATNPLTTNPIKSEKRVSTAGAVSLAAVLELYHEHLPSCQRVAVVSDKRKRTFAGAEKIARQICAANGWKYGLDFWRDFFLECTRDSWTRGEKPHPTNPEWKQNFETLTSEKHFAKIMDRALENLP